MLRLRRSPARSQRKVVRKDQLHYWRSLHNWVVYLKILIRESLFYMTKENGDQNTWSNSPSALGTKKNSGKKGSIAGHYPKHLNLMSIVFARQNSGKDHMRRLCTKKDALLERHGIWRKYYKLKNADKTTVYSLIEAKVMPSPASKSPEEREFVVDSGASLHMMSTMSKRAQERRIEEELAVAKPRPACLVSRNPLSARQTVLRIRVFHTARVQMTPHRTHTRALFLAAHATCDHTFGSRAWRFSVCLEKSFHHWSCLCWMFLRSRFLLSSHHLRKAHLGVCFHRLSICHCLKFWKRSSMWRF